MLKGGQGFRREPGMCWSRLAGRCWFWRSRTLKDAGNSGVPLLLATGSRDKIRPARDFFRKFLLTESNPASRGPSTAGELTQFRFRVVADR